MKNLAKNLKTLLKERDEACRILREGYDKAFENFQKKLEGIFPYKDKYIFIKDKEMYLRVDEMFKTTAFGNNRAAILLRGYGFYSQFTTYADATFAKWDFFSEHYIDISGSMNIEEQINNINIISESEFNKAFTKMIDNMKQEHIKTML